MDRYIGLDAHASSCTVATVGPSGRRLHSQVVETNAGALIRVLRGIPGTRHLCLPPGTDAHASFGLPDLAMTTLNDVCEDIRRITSVSDLPLLVDADDRLGNIDQLRSLRAAGYTGAASFEAFAPEIHDMKDPTAALVGSIAFINAALADVTAGVA